MKKQSMAARLRAARDRALIAEKDARSRTIIIDRIKGDFSDQVIVGDFKLGDAADSAIRTARKLGFVVTVVVGASDSDKFCLRAHRSE